jgi:hypothetical protein
MAGCERLVTPVRSDVTHNRNSRAKSGVADDRTFVGRAVLPACCLQGPSARLYGAPSAFRSGPLGRSYERSSARAEALARRIRRTDTRISACYRVSVNDTSSDAARVQALVHRRMGGPRKLVMACQMSDAVRAMASARIRSRHPELNEREIRDELIWELYGVRRGR